MANKAHIMPLIQELCMELQGIKQMLEQNQTKESLPLVLPASIYNASSDQQGANCLKITGIAPTGVAITMQVDLKRDASAINTALLHKGVIVRPVANYEMPHHLRISIGTQAENESSLETYSK
jgi:hypothetical protein